MAYVYVYIHIYIYIYVSIYVCIYVCIYVSMYLCMYVCMYVCVYIYIYIYIHILHTHIHDLPGPHARSRSPARSWSAGTARWSYLRPRGECMFTNGIGNPRPQPQSFSKSLFLTYFRQSCIFNNWLSGALVRVGGSYFIGCVCVCVCVCAAEHVTCHAYLCYNAITTITLSWVLSPLFKAGRVS